MDLSKASFWGYRRENGRAGVRNHVVILPVDDLSNAAAQAVENSIKGTLELPQWASELRREQRPLKDLWVSTKCGESDTTSGCGANPTVGNAFDKLYPHGVTLVFGETTELTGGEHLVAARCMNDAVRKKFQFVFDRYQELIHRHKTGDLMDSQPTKGNIAGGLTTVE